MMNPVRSVDYLGFIPGSNHDDIWKPTQQSVRHVNQPRPSEKLHHGLIDVKNARSEACNGPDRDQSFHSGCIIGVQPAVGRETHNYLDGF